MTTAQYNSYEEVYRMMHGGWWWQDWDVAGGDSNLLSDVPPGGEVSTRSDGRATGTFTNTNPLSKQLFPSLWTDQWFTLPSLLVQSGMISNWTSMHGTTPPMAMQVKQTAFWLLMSLCSLLSERLFFRHGLCHSPFLSLWLRLSSSRWC